MEAADPATTLGSRMAWAVGADEGSTRPGESRLTTAVTAGRVEWMSRPVWLLDVDGVLNVAAPGWSAPPRHGTAFSGGIAYRMRWAPALMDRIRALHRAGSVEIRWCSTWCSDADQLERLFGLPRFERCWHHEINGAAAGWAKLEAARDVLSRNRRLIWTDDTAVPGDGPIYEELAAAGRALLIAPSQRRGLQRTHLVKIEAFIADPDLE